VDSQKLFPPRVEESITRGGGHRFKVRGARFKGDVRGMFCLHRGWWVPGTRCQGEVVEADTMVTFKGRLDKYMNRMGIEGYGPREGERVLIQTGAAWSVQAWRGRRACSCAVIFFVLCPGSAGVPTPHGGLQRVQGSRSTPTFSRGN